MTELKKDSWLNEIPELIYLLKFKYNFYYSGFYARINKDILDIVDQKKEKNKHKIVLYNRNNRFFLVVYTKNSPDIYYTNEYRDDKTVSRISYFKKKFMKAYNKASEDRFNAEVATGSRS